MSRQMQGHAGVGGQRESVRGRNEYGQNERMQRHTGRSAYTQYASANRKGRRDVSGRQAVYQHGTAVKDLSFEEMLETAPLKKPNHTARKNREKAVQMNLGYVAFLIAALTFAAVVLIGYINLQSEITNSVKRVSRMESELHALKQDNDEYETRINSSVDLEEVKRIAICELGMKYASEGQIIRVEGGGDDYARKYAEIPQE